DLDPTKLNPIEVQILRLNMKPVSTFRDHATGGPAGIVRAQGLLIGMENVDFHHHPCGDGRQIMDSGRLIVVDDEPDLRSMIAEYLGKHGFTVRTAADGV